MPKPFLIRTESFPEDKSGTHQFRIWDKAENPKVKKETESRGCKVRLANKTYLKCEC